MPELSAALLDNPIVLSVLFYPRRSAPEPGRTGIDDGTIPVVGDIVLGYRLYTHKAGAPVIILFHGNGEIASDYDDLATLYHRAGASLMVVDYRGYGWSTGRPLVSTLLSDTEAVRDALPAVLGRAGLSDSPLFVMGRSLGSACAIHLAYNHSNLFRGIIIESGFALVFPLLAGLGVPVDKLGHIPDPIGNIPKIQATPLPLLVIHGERDSLIPIANGETLFDASSAPLKSMARIAGAGHNDLLFHGMELYFTAMARFITSALSSLPETLEH
jgi:alpha-beta hydrolase superfamily lysophospholipase